VSQDLQASNKEASDGLLLGHLDLQVQRVRGDSWVLRVQLELRVNVEKRASTGKRGRRERGASKGSRELKVREVNLGEKVGSI
jgi:hypothetical protein